jgi:hypothetical protein
MRCRYVPGKTAEMIHRPRAFEWRWIRLHSPSENTNLPRREEHANSHPSATLLQNRRTFGNIGKGPEQLHVEGGQV